MVTSLSPSEWFSLFERSLKHEEKHQFTNTRGREFFFADFMLRHLRSFEKTPANAMLINRLENIYQLYPMNSVAERRKQVEESWRILARLRPAPPKRDQVKEKIQRELAKDAKKNSGDWRDVPIQFVKGVGPKMGEKFARVGVGTVGDLLHYYPRTHLDYSNCTRIRELRAGELATVWGRIHKTSSYSPPGKKGLTIVKVVIRDGSGRLTVSWFYKGGNRYLQQQYLKRFPEGAQIIISGKVKWDKYSKTLTLDKPEAEVLGEVEDLNEIPDQERLHLARIVPIYPLTEGLNLKWVRQAMHNALEAYQDKIRDTLPRSVHRQFKTMPLAEALREFHFPSNVGALKQARQRLVFQELFLTQLGLQYRRKQRELYEKGLAFEAIGKLTQAFLTQLPFSLTDAQNRVYREISLDLQRPEPMSRLVQGDVGSGKTVVAILALLQVIEHGFQGALMAPTEILAEQHYRKIFDWLFPLGIRAELLLGSQKAKTKRQALERLASGEAHLAVGTHALIQEGVSFKQLGLAIIDEQHRFGVKQRAQLKAKGFNPEILTMTATPIPRTLALALYGDLDVSVIDELPPGRKPVESQLVTGGRRKQVWDLMRTEMDAGRQCYVVFPLVEESEKMDLRAATVEFERYQSELFPNYRVGLLHGKMKGQNKDRIMQSFSNHELDILVSTTVIEVGVDVPNASVMVIEHPERFGLAQLHQLRGRVGRGADKAYCLLVSDKLSPQAKDRLEIFTSTTDGFVIAEQDLRIRGPGEFLGTRQSGLPDLVLTNLAEDTEVLERSREIAQQIIAADPELKSPENAWLKLDLFRFFRHHQTMLEA